MKKCNKCNSVKDETEFYANQGECKECTKKRVKEREQILKQNPEWVEKEKARHREKYYRLNYKVKHKPTAKAKKEIMKRYKEKYPEKKAAMNRSNHLKSLIKGNHLHHWSYKEEHWKDVIELPPKGHAKIHRYMIYDQERMMYRVAVSGLLLDTKASHMEFANNIINNMPKI